MNLKTRIRTLEKTRNKTVTQGLSAKTDLCGHPPPAMNFYQVQPVAQWNDRRTVTKFHCLSCGYQELLMPHFALDEAEAEYFLAAGFRARQELELYLLNAGLIQYTVYPPSEADKHNALKWNALNRANDKRRLEFKKWLRSEI